MVNCQLVKGLLDNDVANILAIQVVEQGAVVPTCGLFNSFVYSPLSVVKPTLELEGELRNIQHFMSLT